MSTATPQQVLESIVTGINSGNLDSLMPLYEDSKQHSQLSQATSLTAHWVSAKPATVFISMPRELDLEVTRVPEETTSPS